MDTVVVREPADARGFDVLEVSDADELRVRYEGYRRRQAARLVQMMPREAVRPLYRRARAEALRADALPDDGEHDPLALLVGYCQSLLPLPPYEVWLEDLRRNPDGHFADLEDSNDGPTADAPSTMAMRTMSVQGRRWMARLSSFRDGGLWRGYISFREQGTDRVHRTAAIFCEDAPAALRERFLSFQDSALEAFLRSTLP